METDKIKTHRLIASSILLIDLELSFDADPSRRVNVGPYSAGLTAHLASL